jgi:hypothetical protein
MELHRELKIVLRVGVKDAKIGWMEKLNLALLSIDVFAIMPRLTQ